MARYWFRGRVFDSSKTTAQPLLSEDELFRMGMMLRQRDQVQARRSIIEKEQSYMAKTDVSAAEIADVLKIVRGNPAAAARLTELITSGQVEVGIGADGRISVRADEVASTEPTTTASAGTALTSPMRPSKAIDGKTAYKELAEIAGSREGSIALQKKRTGQTLTDGEARIVARHDALMAANNQQARAEAPKLPDKYSTQPEFASRLVRDIAANPYGFQRVNDARQAISEIRADKNHAAWNERDPGYKNARAEVRMLYDLAYPPESMPVEKLEGSKE
jgi:hypothetical protein